WEHPAADIDTLNDILVSGLARAVAVVHRYCQIALERNLPIPQSLYAQRELFRKGPLASSANALKSEELQAIVQDASLALPDRVAGLEELLLRDDPEISTLLIAELRQHEKLARDWCDLLILTTEQVEFV